MKTFIYALCAIGLAVPAFAHAQDARAMFFSMNVRPSSSVSYAGQCTPTTGNGVGSMTITCSGVTAGQTILINSSQFNASVATLTDSNGSVAHLLGPTNFDGGGGFDDVWYVKNAAAGTHVFTATYSTTAGYTTLLANVLSGASATSPIDSSSATSGQGYGLACANVTTSAPGEFLLTFANISGTPLTVGTVPQVMTLASNSGTATAVSAFGTAANAGTNYVEWNHGGVSVDFACDTIAVH